MPLSAPGTVEDLKSLPSSGPPSSSVTPGHATDWHVLGVGSVGQALLIRFAQLTRKATSPNQGLSRLVGLSDSSAVVFDRDGLDPLELVRWKRAGFPLCEVSQCDAPQCDPPQRGGRRAGQVPWSVLLTLFPIDGVVDCTASDLSRAKPALERSLATLASGRRLVLAAKHALLEGTHELLAYGDRVGINAVLGGTGRRLQEELPRLRRDATAFSGVVNATTTHWLEAIERGATHEFAIDSARRAGLLEADPTQDLDGTDAAIKLVIVARAAFGLDLELSDVARPRWQDLDLDAVRARPTQGETTRLVARIDATGASLAYEAVSAVSALAVSSQRVSYVYELGGGDRRAFIGSGIGPEGTARALWRDIADTDGGAQ